MALPDFILHFKMKSIDIIVVAVIAVVGVILVCLPRSGSACGLSTHIEVAHRGLSIATTSNDTALLVLRRIALENEPAFHAGTAFPDLFFSPCGGPDDLSERTHWIPFIETSVEFIREKYGADMSVWNQQARELVSFLMGVLSHQVADVLWHSLGIEQGLIRAMANVNFHGEYDPSHAVADNLDDSIIYFDMSLKSQNRLKPWNVPLTDLMEILSRFQPSANVSSETVSRCFMLQFSLQVLESLILDKMFKVNIPENLFAGARSHFLSSNFYDYHLGGMESMAIYTVKGWGSLERMLINGPSSCTLNNNPLFVKCSEKSALRFQDFGESKDVPRGFRLTARLQARRLEIFKLITGVQNFEGFARARSSGDGRLTLESTARKPENRPFVRKYSVSPAAGIIVAKGTEEYSFLGQSMIDADLNGDGITDVVIGSPGNNQVIIRLGPVGGNTKPKSSQILHGPRPYESFGTSVAVMDINMDGLPDVAVGAPRSRFKGSVYIYYGTNGDYNSVPDGEIRGHDVESDDWEFLGTAMVGASLCTGDMDGDGFSDLVISSPLSNRPDPQSGSVYLVLAKRRPNPIGTVLLGDIANWYTHGRVPYSWFGKRIRAVGADKLGIRKGLILVSAPYERICATEGCQSFQPNDVQSVGKIYGFQIDTHLHPDNSAEIKVELSFTLRGTVENEKLEATGVGFPFRDGKAVLAVGADTFARSNMHPQTGRVTLYYIEDQLLGRGELTIKDVKPLTTFHGDQAMARFGSAIRFLDVDSDGTEELVVTSPFHGKGAFEGQQSGQVLIYRTKDYERNRAPISRHTVAMVLEEPFANKGRFGSNIVLYHAPNVEYGQAESPLQLLISSPLAMERDLGQGLVYAYDLTKHARLFENDIDDGGEPHSAAAAINLSDDADTAPF